MFPSCRLKRLDFQWHEEEGEIQAAAAALAAELANREKHKKIQHLQLQASESQVGTSPSAHDMYTDQQVLCAAALRWCI